MIKEKEFDLEAVQQAMQLISGKWKLPILMSLRIHSCLRFGELQKEVQGIGSKMLSKELKELEETGLILREVTTSSPVRIDYTLSLYGQTLDEVFKTLSAWACMHKVEETSDKHCLNHLHVIDI